jgi:Cu/Ag efflux protein CusF
MKARVLIVGMAVLFYFSAVFVAVWTVAAEPDGSAAELTEGVVRKIDKDAGKITLKHGEIASLSMPPMTMVYRVLDKTLLDLVQPGDKVNFKVINEGGKFVITDIQPVASPPQ